MSALALEWRCAGKAAVALSPCEHCRPLTVLHKVFKLGAGESRPLPLTVPASIRRRLARGLPLIASARVGDKTPTTTFPLRRLTTLTAHCGSLLHLSGTASPARTGLLVTATLAGPPPPGRDISSLDLALMCPATGTAGQQLSVAGRLTPGDGGCRSR